MGYSKGRRLEIVETSLLDHITVASVRAGQKAGNTTGKYRAQLNMHSPTCVQRLALQHVSPSISTK